MTTLAQSQQQLVEQNQLATAFHQQLHTIHHRQPTADSVFAPSNTAVISKAVYAANHMNDTDKSIWGSETITHIYFTKLN